MASKTVKIEPGTCSPPPITVDPPIVKIKKNNTTLKFKNDLVAVAPDPDPPTAMIRFYDIDAKGNSSSRYDDFCAGYPGEAFPVAPGGAVQCDPTVDGQYSYTVTATGYQTHDPVIIIEPQISTMTGGPQPFDAATPSVLMAAVGLVVGLVSGYMLGKR